MACFGKDLEIEILSRLPVKTLLRFRCVCQSWNVLIKSSYFVSTHLEYNRATSKKDGKIPLFFTQIPHLVPRTTFISPDNDEATVDPASLFFFRAVKYFKTILGPVNGLYCIIVRLPNDDERDGVYLCNPALREIKSLWVKLFPSKVRLSYGFGYDSINKDVKFVAFRKFHSEFDCSHVCVYSLKNNGWRTFNFNTGIFSNLLSCKRWECVTVSKPFFVSYVDGAVYCWLVRGAGILSFDFRDEVFRWIDLPRRMCGRLTHIAVLNDELMVYYKSGSNLYAWEAWVMKEYGVKESWTKLLGQQRNLLKFPNGFWNNAEIILYKLKKLKTIHKPSFEQTGKALFNQGQVCTYMESLVSIFNKQKLPVV